MGPQLVSIILPIYKVEAYLPACVESILAQTYRNLELILVDDGSPDGCPALCDAYAAQDARVRVIHQPNGGVSAARNAGLDAASGDYLAFVDPDDWVRTDYIEVLYTLLSQTQSDMAQCGFQRVQTAALPERSYAPSARCYTGQEMCLKICRSADHLGGVVLWNKLYTRQLFHAIRFPVGRVHEDDATIHRLYWAAHKVVVTERQLYFYRFRAGSIVHSGFSEKSLDGLTALEDRAAFYRTNGAEKLWALTLLDLCGMAQDFSTAALRGGDERLSILLRQKSMAAHHQAMSSGQLGPVSRLELGMKRYFPRLWDSGRTIYHRIRGK